MGLEPWPKSTMAALTALYMKQALSGQALEHRNSRNCPTLLYCNGLSIPTTKATTPLDQPSQPGSNKLEQEA